ncbi:MAG: MBOAT family protein [Chitinophagaceae bacterium]|nr:MBOAT family protein [Chitinophagaceae bacterium]
MLFNSLQFLLFFVVVSGIYYALPLKARWIWLLLAGCYFYAVQVPAYIFLLLATILIDYLTGLGMQAVDLQSLRKTILIISILSNLSILFFFKYFNFWIENLQTLSGFFGNRAHYETLSLMLPIGLSFHTFQSMSYSIELYHKRIRAERNPVVFALYVMFFPQLVAGPIERPQHLLTQLRVKQAFKPDQIKRGFLLLGWGMIKKVVISDRLALYSNEVFAHYPAYSFLAVLLAILFFSIQIYCDFSGYSDMARGAANVLGYDLMVNFNLPYFAKSLREFWTRWHISLSTWFRDYVYIPLGGNRKSSMRYTGNILLVFFLSGLWHGSSWNFILWGMFHGVMMVTQHILRKNGLVWRGHQNWSVLFNFIFVSFTWIFFRTETPKDAWGMVIHLLTFQTGELHPYLIPFAQMGFGLMLIIGLGLMEKYRLTKFLDIRNFSFKVITCALMIYFLGVFNESLFIYFQF